MTKLQGALLIGLTVLAFGLRVWAADQVAPYVPDTQIIREAMGLGQGLAGGAAFDLGLEGAGKYPLGLPYFLLAIYGAIFVAGRLSGVFHSVHDFTGWLFLNRVALHVVAVALISGLSALTVPVAFFIARRFEKQTTPWIAAAWVTLSLTLIQFSHQARPHVPVAFFSLLTIYFSLRIYETGALRDYLLAGVAAALACGTLQIGVLALIPLIAAHGLRTDWHRLKTAFRSLLNWRLAAALAEVALGVLLAYPQLVTRPTSVVAVVRGYGGQPAIVLGGRIGASLDAFQLAHLPKNFAYLSGYDPLMVAFGLLALVYFLFKPAQRSPHLILLSFAGVFIVIFGLVGFTQPHYFSPVSPVLAILGARLLTDLMHYVGRAIPTRLPALTIGLGALAVLPMGLYALRLDYLLGQSDTRSQARDWIEANLAAGSEIGTEFRLEMYPTQDSIRRQETEAPGFMGTREQWLSQLPANAYPRPAFALTNLDAYPVKTMALVEELVARHHVEYLVFEQYVALPRRKYAAYEYALTQATRVAVFCPAHPLEIGHYYNLPGTLSTPWTELWTVQSPGPIVQIFSMNPPTGEQPRLPTC